MTVADNVMIGLSTAFAPVNLFVCFLGVTIGTFVGVLPGIGALAAISMALPLTFHLEPTAALIMLSGIFYGTQYGGSTASILLRIPGGPESAVTSLDGYPMAKQGRAGVALFLTTISSFAGGCFAIVLMMLFAPMLAQYALGFGSPEYFSAILLGLVAGSTLSVGAPLKGMAMMIAGLVLGLVGIDINSGQERYTFGWIQLWDGLNLIAVAMGVFGVAEVLINIGASSGSNSKVEKVTLRSMIPSRQEMRASVGSTARGSALGSALGVLPGTGPIMASFMAYALEKRVSRTPERFGAGAVEGVTAPEASNNAAVQTAFIPTLSLGIPGNAVMAVILGAMLIHGIVPGPQIVTDRPEMFWGLIMSFWVGNLLLLILNIPLIGVWIRILSIPSRYLYPSVLFFICIGVFSINNSVADIGICLVFGLVGYALTLAQYPMPPLLLGLVLGPMLEVHFKRSLLLSRGSFDVFFTSGISLFFLGITVLILAITVYSGVRGLVRSRSRIT